MARDGPSSPIRAYLLATLATAAAVLVRWLLDPWLGSDPALTTLYGAVAIAVWYGGYGPALLAIGLGYLACNFLFIEPRGELGLHQPRHFIGLFAYLLSSAVIVGFGEAMRRAQGRSLARNESLRLSEQELADFFENASVGLHWVGPDGRILRVNQAELDLLGYTREEYVGRHIAEFHVDAPVIEDILRCLQAGETLTSREARLRHKDGSIRHVLIDSSVLWEDGRFVHTRCFTRDISARKRAEAELASTQAAAERGLNELATIYATTPIGMCLLDTELRYVRINDRLAEMNGIPAADHLGRTIREMVPQIADELEPAFRRILATGEPVIDVELTGETSAQPGVGRTWLESWFPLRDEHGQVVGINVTAMEITDRKRAEEELRQLDRRKDEFLATLAHELRNPLAPIRNALYILKTADDDPATFERTRGIMERQIDQMVRLVDDLMDVSRISSGKLVLRLAPTDLASILAQAVETCRPLAESSNHRVAVALPAQPLSVNGDAIRLVQVFANLLSNSCKFTRPGGRIEVTAQNDGGMVAVSVTDDGIGIPPAELGGVFEMFSQLDTTLERPHSGLGIGLSLTKRIVELHGGTIAVESAGRERGSRFTVRLPLAARPAEPDAPSVARPVPVTKRRVLVVDDNRDSAESLALLLNLGGHETDVAHDGIEAIDAARRFLPDVVLLDIGLPRLNGYEACRRIREEPWAKHTLVIALTGWGQEADRRRSREAGFHGHLLKPVDHDELMQLFASFLSE